MGGLLPPRVVESIVFFVMGMSGWWAENAIQWAESPIFVERTPERVTIGNALSIACSCGNVFPLVYAKLLSKEAQAKLLPATVMACQGVAFAAALLCALGWKVTAGQHSVVLLLCVFLTAGVGTLSNVTFWAYAGRNDGDHCTKALGNGMTVGGLVVTSAAVSIQQAGCSPRFSVAVFMIMVAGTQAVFFVMLYAVQRQKGARVAGAGGEGVTVSSWVDAADEFNGGDESSFPMLDMTRDRANSDPRANTPRASASSSSLKQGLLSDVKELHGGGDGDGGDGGDGGGDAEWSSGAFFAPPSELQNRLVVFVMFLVYMLTYSLPSLGPFMVQSFGPHQRGHLLSLMNLFQQAGDVTGSVGAWMPWVPSGLALSCLVLGLVCLSGLFVVGASVSTCGRVGPDSAGFLLPALFFVYFFIRRFVVTVMYVWVKKNTPKADAETLTIRMGLYGQVGAVVGPLTQLLMVWTGAFGAPPHSETHLVCDGIDGNEYVSTVPPPGSVSLGSPATVSHGVYNGGSGSGIFTAAPNDAHANSESSCAWY